MDTQISVRTHEGRVYRISVTYFVTREGGYKDEFATVTRDDMVAVGDTTVNWAGMGAKPAGVARQMACALGRAAGMAHWLGRRSREDFAHLTNDAVADIAESF